MKEGVSIENFDPKPAIKKNAENARDWEYREEAEYLYGIYDTGLRVYGDLHRVFLCQADSWHNACRQHKKKGQDPPAIAELSFRIQKQIDHKSP